MATCSLNEARNASSNPKHVESDMFEEEVG